MALESSQHQRVVSIEYRRGWENTQSGNGVRTQMASRGASLLAITAVPWRLIGTKTVLLRGAVGGHEAGFPDYRLGAGGAEAGGLEIRPGLLRAILADGADIQSVALGKGLRNAGFDLGGKAGQYGKRGSNERGSSDCGKGLDHDGPLSWAFAARRFVGWTCIQRKFPAVFTGPENGFVPAEFCFVVHWLTKHSRSAQADARTPVLVHWPI
jgi:hypothetical protein